MRLARGTSSWLLVAWVTTAALLVGSVVLTRWLLVPGALMLAIALILLNFFRDPERNVAQGLVAPADGVIQSIDAWPDGRTRVCTFMNPFNVHVNRAPLSAAIRKVTHVPGGFIPAFNKESDRNERVVWIFDTEIGDLEVVQIAGALARRIIPYHAEGEKVGKGDRIGIIRLGSRVDVYLPPGIAPAVKVGDKVAAGETTLARLPG